MSEVKRKGRKQDEWQTVEEVVRKIGKGFISLFAHPVRLIMFAMIVLTCYYITNQYEWLSDMVGVAAGQMRYLVYIIPLFILIAYGSSNAPQNMDERFESIKFSNKVGGYPKIKRKYRDWQDRRIHYMEFTSPGIPILTWKERLNELETILQCTILSIDRGETKQTAIVEYISDKYRIPSNIRWDDSHISDKDFEVTIGEGLLGPIQVNLDSLPHILVAGMTGSGKSVVLRSILWQCIVKGAKLFMIDFKGGVEFGQEWEKYAKVATEKEPALEMLTTIVLEMQKRLQLFREEGVKKISEYNQKHPSDPLCRIIIGGDELAEVLDKEGMSKEEKQLTAALDNRIASLARLARAAGIHLVFGMQRPDAKVLRGQIRDNLPIRLCGMVENKYQSEMVIGNTKACEIGKKEKGRFFSNLSGSLELQAYLFEDAEMMKPGKYQKGRMLMDTEATSNSDELNKTTFAEEDYQEFEVSDEEKQSWKENESWHDILNVEGFK